MFLQTFFDQYPRYSKLPFFVTGESYGGHYVPAVANRIFTGNNQNLGNFINIQGLAIGNGLTDPQIQYQYYAQMAYNNSIKQVVTQQVYNKMVAATPGCIKQITACNNANIGCALAQETCDSALFTPVQDTGVNLYDIREQCQYPPLCYDFSNLNKYLAQPSVKSYLNVTGHIFHGQCNDQVNADFSNDWMKNYQTDIPALLNDGKRVLIYAGEDDFICNWMGNHAWTLQLEWNGQNNYVNAPTTNFSVSGQAAGALKTYGNFTFLKVFNAGHMVPMNQPANALAMINTLIHSSF
jgi:cathepsin A (carboxypeptidase C)